MGQVFRGRGLCVAHLACAPDPDPRHRQPHRLGLRGAAAGVRAGCVRWRRRHPRGDLGAATGTFLGTVFLARQRGHGSLGRAVFIGSAVSAVSVMVFSKAGWMPLALVAMAGVGFGISVVNVAINMLLRAWRRSPARPGGVVLLVLFGFDALGGLVAGRCRALGGHDPVLEGLVLLWSSWVFW